MSEIGLTETERNVLARYFGMGRGSEIVSHRPHATIGMHRHAFDRLLSLGLLIETPLNKFGVKRITCTEEAARIGRERMLENIREGAAAQEREERTGRADVAEVLEELAGTKVESAQGLLAQGQQAVRRDPFQVMHRRPVGAVLRVVAGVDQPLAELPEAVGGRQPAQTERPGRTIRDAA